jgi:queuine tRNA-ribosyltransferase
VARTRRCDVTNARFARDPAPLDGQCSCEACRGFSRAYLRHLFGARELLAYRLLTLHNLTFYQRLMREMRHGIACSRRRGDRVAPTSRGEGGSQA